MLNFVLDNILPDFLTKSTKMALLIKCKGVILYC